MRFEGKGASDGIGEHGTGAVADVLRRSTGDQSAVSNCEFDLAARLPEVGPIASRYTDAASVAAVFCPARVPRAPHVKTACPVVKALTLNIAIPSST